MILDLAYWLTRRDDLAIMLTSGVLSTHFGGLAGDRSTTFRSQAELQAAYDFAVWQVVLLQSPSVAAPITQIRLRSSKGF